MSEHMNRILDIRDVFNNFPAQPSDRVPLALTVHKKLDKKLKLFKLLTYFIPK